MLIVSKFHDYYDGALKAFGVDKSIVFERKYETIHPVGLMPPMPYDTHNNPHQAIGAVLFCGKMYPFFWTHDYHRPLEEQDSIDYDINRIWRYIDARYSFHKQERARRRSALETAMAVDYVEVHRQYRTPIIGLEFTQRSWNNNNGIAHSNQYGALNPKLSDWKFFHIKGSYETVQDIMMYISGVLGQPDKPSRPQTDKEKVASHGFDRFSFRKDGPPTRKQK